MADRVQNLDSTQKNQEKQLQTLIHLSDKFGDSLANAFAKNVAEGKRFDDILKSVDNPLWKRGCAWRSPRSSRA